MKNDFNKKTEMFNEYLKGIITRSDSQLFDAMNYSLSAGGKRIRPLLVMLSCEAMGGKAEDALPYAAAIEMIHTYSLIHDDLPAMDNDDLRRGKPTCHKQFDEATAILAGDGLLTLAFEIIADAPLSADKNIKAVKALSNAAGPYGMVLGQAFDMQKVADDKILEMYSYKTGQLLIAATALGCIAAGGTGKELYDYSLNLGAAFQIRDDILDVEGDEKLLGKPINSDAKNDKNTIVAAVGIQKAKEMVAEYTEKALESAKTESLVYLANMLINREK